jgi:ABC-type Mn2+/Zn2+ transport system permease subunit
MFGLLFGNILMVSPEDTAWLAGAGAVVLTALVLVARPWWSMALDATTAAASGMPVSLYRMLLFATTGLTVVICVRLAGIVLTTGLLVLPAATAWFWGKGLPRLWLISVGTALTGALIGLDVSWRMDWPSGATVVLALCALFVISWAGSRLLGGRARGL